MRNPLHSERRPPLPREHPNNMTQRDPLAAIHAAIDGRRFGPSMKQALHDLLGSDGFTYRQVGEINGVDWRGLHRNAKSVPGLPEAHLRAWRDWWGKSFPTLWKHHFEAPVHEVNEGLRGDLPARTASVSLAHRQDPRPPLPRPHCQVRGNGGLASSNGLGFKSSGARSMSIKSQTHFLKFFSNALKAT